MQISNNLYKSKMKIILEGNINTGKSTLIKYLTKFFKDMFIVHDSGFEFFHPDKCFNIATLSKIDPKSWSFLRQLNFIKLLDEIQNKKKYEKSVIFNRSIYSAFNIFTQKEYLEGNIDDVEYEFIERVYKKCMPENDNFDLMIYLYASDDVLINRHTNNIFSSDISKFQKLYKSFTLLPELRDKNIILLNTDKNFTENDYKKITDMIQVILNKKN